ncbi:chromosome condensation regulator family protein [Hibiscus syriacus]|uniref:U-box domain-containing protein n=1 Tax=Hibiscus syriacus TaxID=106335 RepID=A0A6A3CXL3_HIBSY|nr:U-box domain-containing protein 29-like [Hibiscus syriacus]KAE8731829.1 chromosome condensation regulator family protein [Hibiscus syriacus]
MVKEELYITVPSVFRCPISLDLMKSPVSLCTGVTYDRSSIQQWLESGHDTCPATMQVLPSKDFIPNLTLHRLINLWIQSSTLRPGSNSARLLPGTSDVPAKLLIEKIERLCCVDSLSRVSEFVSRCEENRRFVVRSDCFVEVIAGVLTKKCVEIEALETTLGILDLILSENGVKERLNKLILKSNRESHFLSAIVFILQNGSLDSKVKSVRVLDSLAFDSESKRRISDSQDLISILLHLLQTNKSRSLNDAVTSILSTVSTTRSIKSRLIENGVVEIVSNSITEKSLKLLATLSSCSEGRSAISSNPKCVAEVVENLLKVSKTATEDAVVVLWSVCCLKKEEKVREAVVEGNGVTKVLVIMQREGEGTVKMMCRDLVKALRAVCKDWCLGSYETKTTHIRPC